MSPLGATAIPTGPVKRGPVGSVYPDCPSVPAMVDTTPSGETRRIVCEPESTTIKLPSASNAIPDGAFIPLANSETVPPERRRIFPFCPSEKKTSPPFTAMPNGSPTPLSGPAMLRTERNSTRRPSLSRHDPNAKHTRQRTRTAGEKDLSFRSFNAVKNILNASRMFCYHHRTLFVRHKNHRRQRYVFTSGFARPAAGKPGR